MQPAYSGRSPGSISSRSSQQGFPPSLNATPFRPNDTPTGVQEPFYLDWLSPDLRSLASQWREYSTPDNRTYYNNIFTGEQSWAKPPVLLEMDYAIAFLRNEFTAQMGSAIQEQQEMKPKSATEISGTHWCIVWTHNDKVFYFNRLTNKSVWDRPFELMYRRDVDQMVSSPIPGPSAQHEDLQHPAQAAKKNIPGPKPNEGSHSAENQRIHSDSRVGTIKRRANISFDDRVEAFREMLEEKKVNINAPFQQELAKFVSDPRCLLLAPDDGRQVFEFYSLMKVEELKERHEATKKAADNFMALLHEAGIQSQVEFATKYSHDPRYLAIASRSHRERLFRSYLASSRNEESRYQTEPQVQPVERSQGKKKPRKEPQQSCVQVPSRKDILKASRAAFISMLEEFVVVPNLKLKDAKKIMKKNSDKWQSVAELDHVWMCAAYMKHVYKLRTST